MVHTNQDFSWFTSSLRPYTQGQESLPASLNPFMTYFSRCNGCYKPTFQVKITGSGLQVSTAQQVDDLAVNPSEFTFSGTDHGVVNLSATVPFDQSRFRFHLCVNDVN